MSGNDPYQPPQDVHPAPINQSRSGDSFLGGFRLSLVIGILIGLATGFGFTFAVRHPYDQILGVMLTLVSVPIGLLILLVADRRVRWGWAQAVRNLLCWIAFILIAIVMFFPVCTGALFATDPMLNAGITKRSVACIVFAAGMCGSVLLTSRFACSTVFQLNAPSKNA